MRCPLCPEPLAAAAVEGASVFSCPDKHGLLIEQKAFSSILDRSWEAVSRQDAEAATFAARPAARAPLPCPACAVAMDRVPYCGVEALPVERCATCDRIWLDRGMLEAILLVVAKMNHARASLEHALRDSWVPIPQQGTLLPADSPEARIMAALAYAPIWQLLSLFL